MLDLRLMERREFLSGLITAVLGASGLAHAAGKPQRILREDHSGFPDHARFENSEPFSFLGEIRIISGTGKGQVFAFRIDADHIARFDRPFPEFQPDDKATIYFTPSMGESQQVTVALWEP